MSQEEIFGVFQSLFSHLNGRETKTLQKHELILLSTDENFEFLAREVINEILTLEGEMSIQKDDIWEFIKDRGYAVQIPNGNISQATIEKLLYSLLVDLQCARLMTGQGMKTELIVEPESSAIVNAIGRHMDEIARKLRLQQKSVPGRLNEIANLKPTFPVTPQVLMPSWDLNEEESLKLLEVIEQFNAEYGVRRSVLSRRLDVTIQAFMGSANAAKTLEGINRVIASVNWKNEDKNIGMWHLLNATNDIFDTDKVSSKHAVKSAVKTVVIGHVPDRGGVPEGYTMEDIGKDVLKANVQLSAKDMNSAKVQSNVKRWTGSGMGVDDGKGSGKEGGGGKWNKGKGKDNNKGGGGDNKGGGYGYNPQQRNKSPMDRRPSNDNNSGGGYYSNKHSGGSYYDNKGKGGGNTKGGGGGYYANKSSGGGGYYDNKGGDGGNYYDNSGGGYYSNKNSGGGGGSFGGRAKDRPATAKNWQNRK